MFIDEAVITVRGGSGGRGCVSFRREAYVPLGGPNGGDGGRGGNVIFLADENTDTLSDFASRKVFDAPKGIFGKGKNKNGKTGDDLILRVPPGTLVKDAEGGDLLADLMAPGDQYLAAHGGRGGYGNAHFATSTRQAPDFAELGEPGESAVVKLELKLVADVGIIGYPSVGKSSLIAAVSSARPKVADYPFTTLVPNLGVVKVSGREFVMCDVPGLIEGASEGKGLGDKFLRHIERCGVLLHLLDISRDDVAADYRSIRKELAAFSPALEKKHEIVALNKIDLVGNEPQMWMDQLREAGIEVHGAISAATHQGTDALMKDLLPIVLQEREKRRSQEESEEAERRVVLSPQKESARMGAYRIVRTDDSTLRIEGKRLEQFTAMTDFGKEGGRQRFMDVIERIGLVKALKRENARPGEAVMIGKVDVSSYIF